MNIPREGKFKLILFLIVFSTALFFFFRTHNKVKKLYREGIDAIAVVFEHAQIYSPPRSAAKTWASIAVYYVDDHPYIFTVEAIVPIGTEFKVCYLPPDPDYALLSNPDQFKDFPKEK